MATSYLSPGVYVEEVDRGSKPIEAVGTNTVGFLGESAKGPLNESVLITNWSQFVKTFGDFKDCSEHLAHAVYGFFNNGGSRCFVVNVGAPEGVADGAEGGAAADKKDEKAPAACVVGGGGRDGLYIGRDGGPGARTGLKCFDEVDEIAIVAAPGQISPAVQDALLSHCETRKDRFAILDSPGDDHRRRRQAAQAARLQVRRVLLPVDPGLRPGQGQHLRSAVGSHRGRVLAHRQRARRPQGAGERDRPRRARPQVQRVARASRTCSTRRASTPFAS